MWIFRVRQNIRNVFRFISILFIILGHYFRNWFTTGPLRGIFDPKGTKRMSRSERLRHIIEDLGPTFVKFGQIIADRPDLASENLRIELKKLQSSAKPFDDDQAKKLIEQELGDNVENVFEEFTNEHIASASIGQVYFAKLKTGEKVVLKIQRPQIRPIIKLDIILMQFFAQKIQKSYPELQSFNIVNFIKDFGEIILKELDFSNEVANMLRFTNMFKENDNVYIPKVFTQYCTPRLLMMEYIEGTKPDSIDDIVSAGFNPQQIAENGMNAILTMILKHGFFHADPHAGNIFIRGNNQLVLIDFGMCASLKPKQIHGLIHFLIGFSEKNQHTIAKSLLELTEAGYFSEIEELEFEINELIEKYAYLDYGSVDISGLFTDTFKLLMKYEIKIPSNLYMLLKTLITIQNLADSLKAELSMVDMIRPYAKEKIMEKFSMSSVKQKIMTGAEDYLYLLENFPKDLRQIMTNFKNHGLQHEINFKSNDNANGQIRGHIYRIGSILMIGFLLVCVTLLKVYNVQSVTNSSGHTYFKEIYGNYPDILFIITFIIAIFVVLRLIVRSKR